MSAEFDKRKQIKLTPQNYDALARVREAYTFRIPMSSLANRAIELGAPELLSTTKPPTKKGK